MSQKDVEIVIGAIDQATAILADVGKSTETLTRQVKHMGEQSEESSHKFEFSMGTLAVAGGAIAAAAAAAASAIAAFKGLGSAFDYVSAGVEAYGQQEKAARGATQAQLDFAASFQVATNVGDELTLALMRQAEAMGIQKDQTDELALAASALAEQFGLEANEALKMTAQAVSGNAGAFAELLPQINLATTEAEKLAIINEAVAGGFGKLTENADTTLGAMQRSSGAFGDLSEKVGQLFDPLYRVVYDGLAIFAETTQTALLPALRLAENGFDALRPVADSFLDAMQNAGVILGATVEAVVSVASAVGESLFGSFEKGASGASTLQHVIDEASMTIIAAITAVEVVATNLDKAFEFVTSAVLLHLEGMRADIEHTLTVAVPAYAEWFATNFTNIITDAFQLMKTVIVNAMTTAADVVEKGFTVLMSGGQEGALDFGLAIGNAMSKSLTEGFEAITDELPEIAARGMTETEAKLTQKMALSGGSIANQFMDKFNERIAAMNVPIDTEVNFEIPSLLDVARKQLGAQADEILGSKTSVGAGGATSLQASESRLLTRGPSQDPATMVAKNTEETNRILKALPEMLAKAIPQPETGDSLRVELV